MLRLSAETRTILASAVGCQVWRAGSRVLLFDGHHGGSDRRGLAGGRRRHLAIRRQHVTGQKQVASLITPRGGWQRRLPLADQRDE